MGSVLCVVASQRVAGTGWRGESGELSDGLTRRVGLGTFGRGVTGLVSGDAGESWHVGRGQARSG